MLLKNTAQVIAILGGLLTAGFAVYAAKDAETGSLPFLSIAIVWAISPYVALICARQARIRSPLLVRCAGYFHSDCFGFWIVFFLAWIFCISRSPERIAVYIFALLPNSLRRRTVCCRYAGKKRIAPVARSYMTTCSKIHFAHWFNSGVRNHGSIRA
jgi:hypothetical protein